MAIGELCNPKVNLFHLLKQTNIVTFRAKFSKKKKRIFFIYANVIVLSFKVKLNVLSKLFLRSDFLY